MIHAHHRKRRSQGGDDSAVNVINIPDALHQWIHENPEKAYELGLLVKSHEEPSEVQITIPEKFASASSGKSRPRLQGEARKKRRTVSFRVPDGTDENGAEVYDELLASAAEKLAPKLGWDAHVPAYFVITAALAYVIQEA